MQHGGHITKDLLGPRGVPVGGGENGVMSSPPALYVSTTGNDTTGDGTYSSPYKTIAKANTTAKDDANYTHIVMLAGTYAEAVTVPRSGLTYTSIGAVTINAGGGIAFNLNGSRDNVVIENVIITGCSYGVLVNVSDDVIVRNCTIHTCTSRGVDVRGASLRVLIEDCLIHTTTGEGCLIQAGSNNAVIRNVEVYGSHLRAFYVVNSTGYLLSNCYSHDHATGYGFELETNSNDGTIEHCWTTDGVHGFVVKTSSGVTVTNCVAWDIISNLFYCKAGVNNTFTHNVGYGGATGFELDDNAGVAPASTGNLIKSNIIANCTVYGLRTTDGSNVGLVADYNDWFNNANLAVLEGASIANFAAWQAEGYDTNGQAVDPAFASTAYGGFATVAASLLNAGHDGENIGLE